MKPYYSDESVRLFHGDCLDVMRTLPDASVDAVVTDPPYGLEFMGKDWDAPWKTGNGFRRSENPADADRENVFGRQSKRGPEYVAGVGFQQWCELWTAECLRVLKPGGHLLAFGGTRTWHRLACAVEDAGFEVRDSIAWLYGSGFPKSLDVSKAIDKRREEDREPRVRVTSWVADECARLGWTRPRLCEAFGVKNQPIQSWTERNPAHAVIPTWENWQRLKALVGFGDDMDAEVLRLNGRKGTHGEAWQTAEVTAIRENAMSNWSMDGGTKFVTREDKAPATPDAAHWQGWGTALKPAFEPIVVGRKPLAGTVAANVLEHGTGALNIDGCRVATSDSLNGGRISTKSDGWDRPWKHDPEAVAAAHERGAAAVAKAEELGRWPTNVVLDDTQAVELDRQSGERTSGVLAAHHTRNPKEAGILGAYGSADGERGYGDTGGASRFFPTFRYEAKAPASERPKVNGTAHPTVKPLDLMRWLVRLVTPPGGTVLEPFAGSGTTVEACVIEGFKCIAIEKTDEYLPLTVARIHRRRDPVAAIKLAGDDLGLFDQEDIA